MADVNLETPWEIDVFPWMTGWALSVFRMDNHVTFIILEFFPEESLARQAKRKFLSDIVNQYNEEITP